MGPAYPSTKIYEGVLLCSKGRFAPLVATIQEADLTYSWGFPFYLQVSIDDKQSRYSLKTIFHTSCPLLGWIQSTFRIGEDLRISLPYSFLNPGCPLSTEVAKGVINALILGPLWDHPPPGSDGTCF